MSERQVQRLLAEGRIEGARKFGVSWLIPAFAAKPLDPRAKRKRKEQAARLLFFPFADLPKGGADGALAQLAEPLRTLAGADIAFRRGEPELAKTVWRQTPKDSEIKLSAASLATAAAVSSGDYELYDEISLYLQKETARAQSDADRALLSLPEALAAVCMAAPSITPRWLAECDFSLFPYELRPFLLYLYAMHLRNTGEYAALLGAVQATAALCEKPETFTWLDVYLGALGASAAYALGDAELSASYLERALALGLPSGFIAPFADYLGSLGGALETVLERSYPEYLKPVTDLWSCAFKNWMRFHNAFTKEHVTTILTAREYQVASLLARGESYAGVARRLNLSVGRVKNIQTAVYGKLGVAKRGELSDFII